MTSAERMVVAAVIFAISAALALMLLPTATESTVSAVVSSATGQGESITRSSEVRHRTLVDVEGLDVIPVLFIPVVLAASPLAVRRTRFAWRSTMVAAAILWVLCVLAAMSIGLFYVPVAGAMLLAALRQRRAGARPVKRARARLTP